MADATKAARLAEAVRGEVAKAVVGQTEVIDALLVGLITGGHVLIEGVPGTAKTLIARAVAHALDVSFKRIQFSPDMMPADVVGTNVFDAERQEFYLRRGPIFANLVLADEINRTPPKTQAALLEAMQEQSVTIDGVVHPLPSPFLVVATQNPVEYEGTYPLPEAQLDRFAQKVVVPYPSAADERAILARHSGGMEMPDFAALGLRPVATGADVLAARAELDSVVVDEGVLDYASAIARATREHPAVFLGASPRAGVSVLVAAKARALLDGRTYVTPDDVKTSALPGLRHRILLRPEVEIEGTEPDSVIADVLESVPVPR
ncbi:MAG: MoxR family ATPase [Anaerosomatales bacterium]|nr:MoxR family ATPase [Coriobacteriia bacterium]MDI6691737.1 MoxR family ATPase [Anaerosomatales bacterium]MDI6842873.1 MoxR family ATPase [Anaerosomatales bacterium]